jgi:pyridinium-3,5-bisthiocarboxylic acid mononucleotide nickel chelatase
MRSAHLIGDEGVTGELVLGALIDAGAPLDELQAAVDVCAPDVRLVAERVALREVLGTTVRVDEGDAARRVADGATLLQRISRAELPEPVRERATAIATRLLRAESLAHGVEAADVHLHELGRPRALARIVAIASALELLDVGRLTVGPVALGSGAVHIAHGRMAVPVPAVLHLMAGFVVESGPWPGELTTPSGAAVLAALATPAPGLPALTLECHGRGGAVVPGSSDMRVLTVLVGRDGSGATPQPPRR